ncbi:MAG: LD-carboxypeptidase [Oligoflexia bacterium]|nr:LD-carboxypeptidase [Oligoflexia bacterium]
MLVSGSRVGVVSPAGIYDVDRLRAGLALIQTWGLVPVLAPNLGERYRYTAGTLAHRKADLGWALGSPELDAVWFARGGYGTVHLLCGVADLVRDGRPIIGFSDATALFCALDRARLGVRVHGPVLHSLCDLADQSSQAALRSMLLDQAPVRLQGVHLAGPRRPAQGRLVGGNLCVLASLAGTPWALDGRGAIVVLEDIGEPPYKLDRLVTQLMCSGALDGVVGIALGSFTGCQPPADASWTLEDLLADLLAPLGVPVVGRLPIGHTHRNHAWQHGAVASLSPDALLSQAPLRA